MPAVLNSTIEVTPRQLAALFRQLSATERRVVLKELEQAQAAEGFLTALRALQGQIAHVPPRQWRRDVDQAVRAVRQRERR